MPRPCQNRHDLPENYAQEHVVWSNTQCAICWSYLNNPAIKKQYDTLIAVPINTTSKKSGCCGKIVSAIKSFSSWTGQAFRKPNEEQLKTRETICQSNVCGKWDSKNDKCNECGCWLKKVLPIVGDVGKRNHADEACPLNLWKEIPRG